MIHIQTKHSLDSSHMYITDKSVMTQDVLKCWEFMDAAYNFVPGGFKSFEDGTDMIDSSMLLYLTYDGPEPDPKNIDWNKIYCATICKSKFGLKTVAFGQQSMKQGKVALSNPESNSAENVDFRTHRKVAVNKALKWQITHGWVEASGKLEELYLSLGAYKIPYRNLSELEIFKDRHVQQDTDGYHYFRNINGQLCRKLALGKIKK